MISTVSLVLVVTLAVGAAGQGCMTPLNASSSSDPSVLVMRSLKLWQGVILIVCFGVFGVFVALMHRLLRAFVFYDDHMVDTYFDAGGEANFALIACAVVAKRLWTASYTFSTADVTKFGLVGHFWYSAAGVIHLLLFAILASEIRIKAPGARTFLQVIRSRFGKAPHVTVMIFAFVTNIIIAGLVMAEGTRILTWLCQDIDQYTICIILTLAVGLYTLIGGLGGAMYVAYFLVAGIFAICLVYFSDIAFDSLHRPDRPFQDFFSESHAAAICTEPNSESMMTFLSRGGLMQGIIFALAGFSSVFVNQGFWLTAISGRPTHSVWGYLTGAFVWFAVPFLLSFILGMSYWKLSANQSSHIANANQIALGAVPVLVSQQVLGRFGDFMMYALTLAVVLGSVSSEILSISSIIVYDVYQTYVSAFNYSQATIDSSSSRPCITASDQRKVAGDEYLAYNRKSFILKWFTVTIVALLVYPITLIILSIGMSPQWLFNFLGVIVGSAVIPVVLSVTWHRTTGAGVMTGVIIGLISGFSAWLIYASRFDNGLSWFQGNTGRPEVFIVGLAISLGVGGFLCVFVSLACGGCDPHRNEEDEWEKCRGVDNPILPWMVRYSSDYSNINQHTGLPHFFALRQIFRGAEVSAYVLGVLLSAGALVVWPALMLLAKEFSVEVYRRWGIMVLVWAVIAGAFICIVPLLYEIIDKCCVSYHIRLWKHRLVVEEETPASVTPANTCDRRTVRSVVYPSGTTCSRSNIVARRTYRLADLSVTNANLYPIRYQTGVIKADYESYPTSAYVGTYRGGSLVTKGWQTLVHLD